MTHKRKGVAFPSQAQARTAAAREHSQQSTSVCQFFESTRLTDFADGHQNRLDYPRPSLKKTIKGESITVVSGRRERQDCFSAPNLLTRVLRQLFWWKIGKMPLPIWSPQMSSEERNSTKPPTLIKLMIQNICRENPKRGQVNKLMVDTTWFGALKQKKWKKWKFVAL